MTLRFCTLTACTHTPRQGMRPTSAIAPASSVQSQHAGEESPGVDVCVCVCEFVRVWSKAAATPNFFFFFLRERSLTVNWVATSLQPTPSHITPTTIHSASHYICNFLYEFFFLLILNTASLPNTGGLNRRLQSCAPLFLSSFLSFLFLQALIYATYWQPGNDGLSACN